MAKSVAGYRIIYRMLSFARVGQVIVAAFSMTLIVAAANAAQACQSPAATAATASTPLDLSTPQKTLTSFAAALLRGDWDNAVRCVRGAAPGALTDQFKTEPRFPIASYKITQVKIKPVGKPGDEVVTATYVPVIAMVNGTRGETTPPETLILRKGEIGWQIVPMERAKFRPNENGMLTELSFLLANPDVALAARAKAREVEGEEKRPAAAGSGGVDNARNAREAIEALTDAETMLGVHIGSRARLYQDRERSPVVIGVDRASLDAYVGYLNLKRLRSEHPEPFVKAKDGFSEKEFTATLRKFQSEADATKASGKVRLLPHGTPVKVTDHIQGFSEKSLLSTDNPLQLAMVPAGSALFGLWRVELENVGGDSLPASSSTGAAGGAAEKGNQFWTYHVHGFRPDLGDIVSVGMPTRAGQPVPAATDWQAGQALSSAGRPTGDAAAQARFDRLVKAKRFVLLPAGTRCRVDDAATDGSVYLLQPLDGPLKGRTVYIRTEHVVVGSGS